MGVWAMVDIAGTWRDIGSLLIFSMPGRAYLVMASLTASAAARARLFRIKRADAQTAHILAAN